MLLNNLKQNVSVEWFVFGGACVTF